MLNACLLNPTLQHVTFHNVPRAHRRGSGTDGLLRIKDTIRGRHAWVPVVHVEKTFNDGLP